MHRVIYLGVFKCYHCLLCIYICVCENVITCKWTYCRTVKYIFMQVWMCANSVYNMCVHDQRVCAMKGGLMYSCPISQWPNSLWLSPSHSVVVMDSVYHHIQSPCLHYSGTPLNLTNTWCSSCQRHSNQYLYLWVWFCFTLLKWS